MSTDNQRLSLPSQAVFIRRFAEAQGFQVVQTYEDAGRSGLTLKQSRGLSRLLQDVVKATQGTKQFWFMT